MKFRFIYELIKDKIIMLKYCPITEQVVDMLTKSLEMNKFEMIDLRKFQERIVI